MNDLAIWWVTPGNEMHLQHREEEVDALPSYIAREVRDLFGRSMRGRLWISPEITPKISGIDWDDTKPCTRRAAESGGIVIYRKDMESLSRMPGFITDLGMTLLQELH